MATAVMPAGMKQPHVEILCQIAAGKSTNCITKNLQHSPKLIPEIPDSLSARASTFQPHQAIRAPKKGPEEVADYVECLTHFNGSMLSVTSNSPGFPWVSPSTGFSIQLHFGTLCQVNLPLSLRRLQIQRFTETAKSAK
jgi:hypothetical protein